MTDKCPECGDTGLVYEAVAMGEPLRHDCPRGCKPPEPSQMICAKCGEVIPDHEAGFHDVEKGIHYHGTCPPPCPLGCRPPEPDHEAALCAAIERNLVTPPAAPERRCSLCCTAIIDMQEATQQTGGAWHHDRMTMCIANLQSEHSALRAKVERLEEALVFAQAEVEATGSMMLSVQQDCIKQRTCIEEELYQEYMMHGEFPVGGKRMIPYDICLKVVRDE